MRRRFLLTGGGNNRILYTTNNGNIVNVHDYWKTAEGGKFWPVLNYYNKNKDLGVMVFSDVIEEIPGVNGHPFLYSQTNLLTLQLPDTITKLGRGAFFGCNNLYQVNVEDLYNLDTLLYGVFERTAVKKLDFRNSKLTVFNSHTENDGQAILTNREYSPAEYILFPSSIIEIGQNLVSTHTPNQPTENNNTRIKTLMIPTLHHYGDYFIEDSILENLIINKFDGIAHLHYFNTDCVIWVPDEFYDEYIEYYTNNTDYENWQDIVSRLRKYSEGVPEFPME